MSVTRRRGRLCRVALPAPRRQGNHRTLGEDASGEGARSRNAVAAFVHARQSPYTAAVQNPVAHLKSLISDVPDFPEPGVMFRDITPLLADAKGLALSIELLANPFRGENIDLVVGAESRGFIFGTAVAQCLSAGFGLVRKPGKLPRKSRSKAYNLEYGSNTLEIHEDTIKPGQRVLICDDVLATGGTMEACIDLVEDLGGVVAGIAVLIELKPLDGRAKVGRPLHSVVVYE